MDHYTHHDPAVRQRIAEARAEGARAVLEAVRDAAPRLNAELRHDGTEDRVMAAYVAGFHDAYDAARWAAEQTGATP